MTIFVALLAMALAVLAVEAAALLFRATLPKDMRPDVSWAAPTQRTE